MLPKIDTPWFHHIRFTPLPKTDHITLIYVSINVRGPYQLRPKSRSFKTAHNRTVSDRVEAFWVSPSGLLWSVRTFVNQMPHIDWRLLCVVSTYQCIYALPWTRGNMCDKLKGDVSYSVRRRTTNLITDCVSVNLITEMIFTVPWVQRNGGIEWDHVYSAREPCHGPEYNSVWILQLVRSHTTYKLKNAVKRMPQDYSCHQRPINIVINGWWKLSQSLAGSAWLQSSHWFE